MNKILLSIFSIILTSTCFGQQIFGLDWVISGTDTLERAYALKCISQVVDDNGNLFVIGTLEETADFDPSLSEFNLTSRSRRPNLFLAKYDSLNNLIWAKGIGGRGIDEVSSLAIDASGNVVFVGQFRGKLFYDTDQDTNYIEFPYIPGQNLYWPYHGYLIKYDTNGNLVWANAISTYHTARPSEAAIDSDNNIIITGKFRYQAHFGANYQDTLYSDGTWDIFMAKYDSLGQYLWSNSIGGIGDDEGRQVAIDNANNIYISGIIQDTVDMDPSPAIALETATTHNFLAKYDTSGAYSWSHCYNTGLFNINDVQVDNSNNIVFTGNNSQGGYLEKRDTSGNLIWFQQITTNTNLPRYLTVDSSNEIFVTGDYDTWSSSDNLFISKYDSSGNQLFMNLIEGDFSNDISGISLISGQKPIITGYYVGATDFDPSAGTYNLSTLNGGNSSSTFRMGFVASYNNNGSIVGAFSIGNHYFQSYSQGGYHDFGKCVTIDSEKSAYVSGIYEGATDFDPSANEAIMSTDLVYTWPGAIEHREAAFIAKYDSLSNYQWSIRLDSTFTFPMHVTDSSDDLYFVTTIAGSVDVDPSSNTLILSPTLQDGIVVKYDKNGNLIWGFLFEPNTPTSNSLVRHIVLDTAENILVSGKFVGTVDFNPLGAPAIYTAYNGNSFFLAKYDANGTLIWFKDLNGVPVGQVKVTLDNEFVIAGKTSGTVDFDPSSAVYSVTSWPGAAIYMAKYSALGDFQWVNTYSGPGLESICDFEIGTDHFYIMGKFEDSIDLDPSPLDGTVVNQGGFSSFLSRYNLSDGSLNWCFAFDGNGAPNNPHALDLDDDENIAVYGNFAAGLGLYSPYPTLFDLDPSIDTASFASSDGPLSGGWSDFVAIYDSLGSYIWATNFPGGQGSTSDNLGDIYIDDEQIMVTGAFEYHTDFTPSTISNPIISRSGKDFFLAKLEYCMTKYTYDTLTVCGSHSWYNQMYTTSGDYTKTLPQINGCDSILYLNLTVLPIDTTTLYVTQCDSYTWNNGTTYFSSGIYSQVLTGTSGCDSIALLDLFIPTVDTAILTVVECDSFTWTNGVTYMSNGTYSQTLSTSNGCDSISTLFLTIDSPSSTTVISSCGPYLANNGMTYSTSGTYFDTLVSSLGCDSINELNLTILSIDSSFINITECNDSYTWTNGVTYTSSGTYSQTLSNSNGCDSISTLFLTIDSPSSTTVILSCGPYLANNGMTYSTSGTYFDTLVSSLGCDSINELNLTILSIDSTLINITECNDSYTWTNGVTYFTDGLYNQVFTNSSGCDSIVELNLTLLGISNATATLISDTSIICNNPGLNYQWIDCATLNTIPGANSQIFLPNYNSFFAVVITDGSCSDTSNCIEIVSVGLKEMENASVFLYPNPTNGKVTIDFDEVQNSLQVIILDASGRQVFIEEFTSTNTIELSFDVANGLYFVNIQDDENSLHQFKVIKE